MSTRSSWYHWKKHNAGQAPMGHEGSTRFRPKGSEGVNLNQRFYLGFSGNGKAAQHEYFRIGSLGLLQWLRGRKSACSVGDTGGTGLIPGSVRFPGRGHGNPLRCSCLEDPTDEGAWWATVHGVAKNRIRLSDFLFASWQTHSWPSEAFSLSENRLPRGERQQF